MDEENILTDDVSGDVGLDGSDSTRTGVEELLPPDDQEEGLEKTSDQTSAEIEALKTAMLDERGKRQSYEGQLRAMQQFLIQQQQQQHEPEDDYSDDDPLTKKEVQAEIKKLIAEYVEPQMATGQEKLIKQSDVLARQRYTDYDEVIQLFHEMNKSDTTGAMEVYVRNSADPAEVAYRLGRTHPRFERLLQESTNMKIANKINANAKKQKTLSDTGGVSANEKNVIQRIKDASFDEIEEMIAKSIQQE